MKRAGMNFNVWDVGGQDKLRPKWRHYFHGCEGVIFMVDSTDIFRMATARKELHGLAREVELLGVVVLVLANKSDMEKSLSKEDIAKLLELDNFKAYKCHIQKTVATDNVGVDEGLEWLAAEIRASRKQKRTDHNRELNS